MCEGEKERGEGNKTFPAQENGESRAHNRGEKSQLNHDNYFRCHARELREQLLIRTSMLAVAV